MSTKSAGLAAKMGYTNIKVMLKGAPGWKKTGNMLVASDSFVKEGNIILVDVRDPAAVEQGHIARAVNIPLAELDDAEMDFPVSSAAPIVIYGEKATEAVKTIKGWQVKYKVVSLVNGDLEGWQARGNQLANGPAGDEINWVRKLGKGEVSVADFKKAIEDDSKIILDVRGTEEVTVGKFPKAVNIPLDQLETRMSELPKDKEILIHCSTGARAEMAHTALTKEKYNCKYLVANVVSEDGACEIEM